MERYRGKNVILTGAANGIGLATAKYLANEGARLLLVDRSEAVAEIGTEIAAATLVCDLAEDAGPAKVAEHAASVFDAVDVLVNNAGIGGGRPIAETTDELFDRVVGVNLRSVFRVIRETLKLMRRPGGNIVNISSTLGLAGHPDHAAYGAAKGAIAQMTRQMAAELGPEGIRVNAIAPGVIRTSMTAAHIDNNDFYNRTFIATAPLRGYGTPEDIATAIGFLGSDEAQFISAHVLVVDGGWLGGRHPPKVV